MKGKILSINISSKRGEKKRPISVATLVENFGILGDAHGGDSIRQVSLLSVKEIEKIKKLGVDVASGDFAENLTIEFIDAGEVNIGDRFCIGDAVLEVTRIGKKCHQECNIFKQAGYCVMPEHGIFTRVIKGGEIKVGDIFEAK